MIGVLIPVHNEEALLAECLKAAVIAANHPGLFGSRDRAGNRARDEIGRAHV